MHQQVLADHGDSIRNLTLPPANSEVLPGVPWGAFETFFTPAFWATRAWLDEPVGRFRQFRLGETLSEEVAACLLGGFGIPAEVGLAAFERLRRAGVLQSPTSTNELEKLLTKPLEVRGRLVRYRFPRQKARYLASSLEALAVADAVPTTGRDLRAYLQLLPGVGPKTASWITRNWLGSDEVAIIDVHIYRACVVAGVFPPSRSPASAYEFLEQRFLDFARALGSRPSILDNIIWQTMRRMSHLLPAAA